jgi:hypothetical protein
LAKGHRGFSTSPAAGALPEPQSEESHLGGEQMIRVRSVACLFGAVLLMTGCIYQEVKEISQEVSIDPVDGHETTVTTWRYQDGVVVKTTDIKDALGNPTHREEPAQRIVRLSD